ncbi:hypothetical protein CHUAL_007280 [Chamberlinius hualienensis]
MEIPDSKERFSLQLLDPGEIYFEDYAVYYYPFCQSEEESMRRCQRGRLKVCSKSIVFDPKEFKYPVIKFPLQDCVTIKQWPGSLLSRLDPVRTIVIETQQVIEILENNVIAPFHFKRETIKYLFTLNYAKVEDCLPHMLQLCRASTLPSADQANMVNAIVRARQRMVKFDNCWIEDLHETVVLEFQSNRITPLVTNPGRVLLTNLRLYFQPFNNIDSLPVYKIKLSDIKRIVKRRYLLRHTGLELYCSELAPLSRLFLSLKTPSERDDLYSSLTSQPLLHLEDTGQENMIFQWQNGVISNYDYLMYLNSMADRSFNDLTQYPVFPWVIADYTSQELNLNDPKSFRDLSKPIGALNEERLQKLKARCNEMTETKFLYGSHYSTPGFVLYYLVRKVPSYMLCLHGGRFDHADRMFNSIIDAWNNVTRNAADFKELIPEFYQPENGGDFLVNSMNLNFGLRQDGRKVDNVELPKWARDSKDCIKKFRDALESEYVSESLHLWIDLMFGFKQRGKAAELADNLFYYLTYEGAVDLDSIEDANERHSLEVQIMEFGQVPKQIFTTQHPKRFITNSLFDRILIDRIKDGVDKPAASSATGSTEIDDINDNKIRWVNIDHMQNDGQYRLHKGSISTLCLTKDDDSLFSVSHDTVFKMFSMKDRKQARSINLASMALSSCQIMPDEKSVIIGSWDNCVYLYSVEYGKTLEMTMAHDDAVSGLFWNKNLLATVSWDATAKLWDYKPPTTVKSRPVVCLQTELDHDTKVTTVCLTSDNSRLITGTNDGYIYIWDIASTSLDSKNKVHDISVNGLALSPDNQRLLSCAEDIKVLDLKSGTNVFTKNSADEFRSVNWTDHLAIAGGHSGQVYLWDLLNGQLIEKCAAHKGPISSVVIANNTKTFITGGDDGYACVWKI